MVKRFALLVAISGGPACVSIYRRRSVGRTGKARTRKVPILAAIKICAIDYLKGATLDFGPVISTTIVAIIRRVISTSIITPVYRALRVSVRKPEVVGLFRCDYMTVRNGGRNSADRHTVVYPAVGLSIFGRCPSGPPTIGGSIFFGIARRGCRFPSQKSITTSQIRPLFAAA